jgi:hypothetical protein
VLRPGSMRRRLRIRVVFEPARLSAEHLRSAYERVAPVVCRELRPKVEAERLVDPQRSGLVDVEEQKGVA